MDFFLSCYLYLLPLPNAIEAGDAENLKLVYLTGGGSRINPLVFALQACGMGVRAVTSQFEVASNAKLSPKPQRTTLSEAGQSLERIATALGGCSLIADHALESSLNISLRPKPLAVPKVSREPRECTCHGLNPECGRCGGSGYLD